MPSANDFIIKCDRDEWEKTVAEYARLTGKPAAARPLLHYILRSWRGYRRAAERRATNGDWL